jgi:hypothetical protein
MKAHSVHNVGPAIVVLIARGTSKFQVYYQWVINASGCLNPHYKTGGGKFRCIFCTPIWMYSSVRMFPFASSVISPFGFGIRYFFYFQQ